ncbi:MAG: hypothetical protein KDK54_20320 [Leptospiraceae bacterium]|nr:hypothetical protein [Leptospiraceae bacterium]
MKLIETIKNIDKKYPQVYWIIFVLGFLYYILLLNTNLKFGFRHLKSESNQQIGNPNSFNSYFSDLKKVRELVDCKDRIALFTNIGVSKSMILFDVLDYPVAARFLFSPCRVVLNPGGQSESDFDLLLYHTSSYLYESQVQKPGKIESNHFIIFKKERK